MAAFKQLIASIGGIKGKKGKKDLDATNLWVHNGEPLYHTRDMKQTEQDKQGILFKQNKNNNNNNKKGNIHLHN